MVGFLNASDGCVVIVKLKNNERLLPGQLCHIKCGCLFYMQST